MGLHLQMAGDLSKLVSFSKLKWQVTFIVLLFSFLGALSFGLFTAFLLKSLPPAGKGIKRRKHGFSCVCLRIY